MLAPCPFLDVLPAERVSDEEDGQRRVLLPRGGGSRHGSPGGARHGHRGRGGGEVPGKGDPGGLDQLRFRFAQDGVYRQYWLVALYCATTSCFVLVRAMLVCTADPGVGVRT